MRLLSCFLDDSSLFVDTSKHQIDLDDKTSLTMVMLMLMLMTIMCVIAMATKMPIMPPTGLQEKEVFLPELLSPILVQATHGSGHYKFSHSSHDHCYHLDSHVSQVSSRKRQWSLHRISLPR